MDKRIAGLGVIALTLYCVAFAARAVHAQAALEPTQIMIGASGAPDANGIMTVQAILGDSRGRPISKEVIYFTTQAKFLNGKGNVVLTQAVTNSSGQPVALFSDSFSGAFALSAEFRGDGQYAPASATVQLGGAPDRQEYAEHVGVDLPGFNVPPAGIPMASAQSPQGGLDGFIQRLWPAMNGWPVAAVLLLVWSMYFIAVTFVFRVAAAGGEPGEASDLDGRGSS